MNTTDTPTKPSAPPVFKDRVGASEVAVFVNQWGTGPAYSVKLAKSYKTDTGYKQTNSFSPQDLQNLKVCLERGEKYMEANPLKPPSLSQHTPSADAGKRPPSKAISIA